MKRRVAFVVLPGLLAVALWAFQGSPSITTVEPESGKAGDTASAKGDNLAKSSVSEIYVTDQKKDTKLVIVEQTDKEIKFKVPKVAAGRYHLMVLTANKTSLIEEPVVFTIEE